METELIPRTWGGRGGRRAPSQRSSRADAESKSLKERAPTRILLKPVRRWSDRPYEASAAAAGTDRGDTWGVVSPGSRDGVRGTWEVTGHRDQGLSRSQPICASPSAEGFLQKPGNPLAVSVRDVGTRKWPDGTLRRAGRALLALALPAGGSADGRTDRTDTGSSGRPARAATPEPRQEAPPRGGVGHRGAAAGGASPPCWGPGRAAWQPPPGDLGTPPPFLHPPPGAPAAPQLLSAAFAELIFQQTHVRETMGRGPVRGRPGKHGVPPAGLVPAHGGS